MGFPGTFHQAGRTDLPRALHLRLPYPDLEHVRGRMLVVTSSEICMTGFRLVDLDNRSQMMP